MRYLACLILLSGLSLCINGKALEGIDMQSDSDEPTILHEQGHGGSNAKDRANSLGADYTFEEVKVKGHGDDNSKIGSDSKERETESVVAHAKTRSISSSKTPSDEESGADVDYEAMLQSLLHKETTTEKPTFRSAKNEKLDKDEKITQELIKNVREKLETNETLSRGHKASGGPDDHVPVSYRLKGIRSFLVPDLLAALAKAGEGESFLLAANSFPSTLTANDEKSVIRVPGVSVKTLFREIMKLIELCTVDPTPLIGIKDASGKEQPIWKDYIGIANTADNRKYEITSLSKAAFMERAKKVSAIFETGDKSCSNSIIITKGKISGKRYYEVPPVVAIMTEHSTTGPKEEAPEEESNLVHDIKDKLEEKARSEAEEVLTSHSVTTEDSSIVIDPQDSKLVKAEASSADNAEEASVGNRRTSPEDAEESSDTEADSIKQLKRKLAELQG